MSAAAALIEVAVADPFATGRALSRLAAAGFTLEVRESRLLASPFTRLSAPQRAYLRVHKTDLMALLEDAETLAKALVAAGDAGIGWHEGTPADWPVGRLLAAGEALYATRRMVSVNGRRYASAPTEPAPPKPTRIWDSERGCWTVEGGAP